MRVSGASLGIGGGEDSVDKNEGSDDLRTQSGAYVVAVCEGVGAAAEPVVERFLESLHQTHSADGAKALSHHVHHGSHQRHLPGQEQTESHCRVYVTTCGVL